MIKPKSWHETSMQDRMEYLDHRKKARDNGDISEDEYERNRKTIALQKSKYDN